jgi:hypothetical protein
MSKQELLDIVGERRKIQPKSRYGADVATESVEKSLARPCTQPFRTATERTGVQVRFDHNSPLLK